ncbi:MAG TPA: MFS transporter [Microvirga sp.]|jgi:PPP family 3-phenylpropionic acid transporter
MSSAARGLGARLSVLHAAAFIGIGFYMPFFPVWLQSKAFDSATIGLLMAIPIVVRILATAPLLALADRALGPRRLLLASHVGQIVGYPLAVLTTDPLLIGALMALLALAHAAVIPANDLVTTQAVRRHEGLHYGRIRVWGSVAFLAASVAAGYLVDFAGPDVVIWALVTSACLAVLATLAAVENRNPAAAPKEGPAEGSSRGLPRVLWVVMIGAAFIQGSHGAIYTFGSIHWRSIGYTDSIIGYLWAVGVVAEILVFYFLGTKVGRGSAGFGLLLVGAVSVVMRFGILAFDPGLGPTFALQALHGLTFGAAHLGAMAALAALAPDEARGRAQGMLGSVMALAMATTTVLSGFLYRAFGPGAFLAMAPLGAIGLVLILVAMRMGRTSPPSP